MYRKVFEAVMYSFFNQRGNTSIENIKRAIEYFKKNPDGKIKTGIWDDPEWNKEKFDKYLKDSLNKKITSHMDNKGRKFSDEYLKDLSYDRRFIEDYLHKNIRMRGSGLLKTKEMKKKYPHINIVNWEE